jgi:hypothetical protein
MVANVALWVTSDPCEVMYVVVACVWRGPANKWLFLLCLYGTDMSASTAADSDSKSGVAVIKAEYVFMYLNCRNYNRLSLH